jgi:hypothetical protein
MRGDASHHSCSVPVELTAETVEVLDSEVPESVTSSWISNDVAKGVFEKETSVYGIVFTAESAEAEPKKGPAQELIPRPLSSIAPSESIYDIVEESDMVGTPEACSAQMSLQLARDVVETSIFSGGYAGQTSGSKGTASDILDASLPSHGLAPLTASKAQDEKMQADLDDVSMAELFGGMGNESGSERLEDQQALLQQQVSYADDFEDYESWGDEDEV